MVDGSSPPSPTLTTSSMLTSLRQRLLSAETEFLAARDLVAFEEFGRRWDVLCDDFQLALEQGIVDDDLKSLGTSICYRVAVVGESLLELHKEVSVLDEEFNKLLADMTLDDLYPSTPAHPQIQSSTPESSSAPALPNNSRTPHQSKSSRLSPTLPKAPKSSRPPFIAPAYNWLLDNFYDPYPSSQVSRSIAKEAGSSPSTISKWFKSMRTYIGWESLCRKRFAGQRRFAVTAAKRLFSSDSSQSDLPPDVARDILVVKSKLDHLYFDELSQEYTSAITASHVGHKRQISASSDGSIDAILTTFPLSSRPSSPSSLGSSSSSSSRVPSLVFSSDYDSEGSEGVSQPSNSQGSDDRSAELPAIRGPDNKSSGPSSVDQTGISLRSLVDEISHPSASTSNPRKRRRSDADVYAPNKRASTTTTTATIRPQIVSVPISEGTVTADPIQPSVVFQPFLQDESSNAHSFGPYRDVDLLQYVNLGLSHCKYSNTTSLCEQGIAEMWASDSRPLSEIIRDAPTSTTLKNLPLPDVGSSSDCTYPTSIEQWNGHVPCPESANFSALSGRELPPIRWSSSSLAGALGPPDERSNAPLESNKTLDDLLAEVPGVKAISETQDLQPQTPDPWLLDAILPNHHWSDPFGEVPSSSISSRLEEADSSDLQQLLDLLDSPLYAGSAF